MPGVGVDLFLTEMREHGFDFFTGVPCSFLQPLINEVIASDEVSFVIATSEGEAGGIAAGAWLGGKRPVVLLQNSGLGNLVNPITSLNHTFKIPSLLIVTWRGQPGLADEPQHELMGQLTHSLLELLRIPFAEFPRDNLARNLLLKKACDHMDATGLPFAIIVRKDDLSGHATIVGPSLPRQIASSITRKHCGDPYLTRYDALSAIDQLIPADTAVVATTGKTGRELFTVADRDRNLYVVGSMGCASAIGLGLAMTMDRKVLVIDGDGAALMKLGNLATIGAKRPRRFAHILLDNGVHDSTGGQATSSATIDFAGIAAAAGYQRVASFDNVATLNELLRSSWMDGPSFLHLRIAAGSPHKLGRPSVGPVEVSRRFRNFVRGTVG